MGIALATRTTREPQALTGRPKGWSWAWAGSLVCTGGLIVAAFARPAVALTIFWDIFVPLVPLLFLVAPGLWRDICPMAILNQLPRRLGLHRTVRLPGGAHRYASIISVALLCLIVPLRKVGLEQQGWALGVLLITVLLAAFVGGMLFKGKSGWCGTFCPLSQLESLYGQRPLVTIRDVHCRPCVGCVRTCYDLQPATAYIANLHAADSGRAPRRAWLAGVPPWLILVVNPRTSMAHATVMGLIGLYALVAAVAIGGVGLFLLCERLSRGRTYQVALGHVAVALNLYYLYAAPVALHHLGATNPIAPGVIRVGVAALSILWLRRALPAQRAYLQARPHHHLAAQCIAPIDRHNPVHARNSSEVR